MYFSHFASVQPEKINLNPSKQVDLDWTQSWNPAVGKPKKFIDINCLTRVPDVMQYFCFTDRSTPEQLDMNWLLRFVVDRHPYDLISGSIFLDQSQAFEYKMKSFRDDFVSLEMLSSEYHETFRQTLFISWGILTHLFEGQPISNLYSNVRNKTLGNGNERGKTQYIFRIQRRTSESHSAAASVIQSNSSFSDDNGSGDGSNDGDSDNYNDQGQPGRPQQQRGANGGSDRRSSKRSRRGENDGAEGSSSEGDSDEEEDEEQDSGDLSPLNASEADVNVTDISDMSVLSDLAADHSASRESVDGSAVIDSETKDIAEAAATESSEDVKGVEQATSPSSEAVEGAIPEASVNDHPKSSLQSAANSVQAAKTIDDRKAAASAPPTTSNPAASWNDTASVAGTEVCAAAAADTRTLIDEAETVNWNDAKTQRDDDSDGDDGNDAEVDIGKKRASSSVVKYNRREKTPHVANVGLGALTARTLTDVVTAMENPLMWDCPYVQLRDVLSKVLARLNKDKVGEECDVDVVRVLLDLVENNRSSLDLSSTSMRLLGSLKPVTGAVLLDAASKGEIAMDVHGKVVNSDAVYVPRGRNPLYVPLVMAVFGHDDISHIKKLETMMTGKRTDHIKLSNIHH
jgi:hypothetical protein